MRTIFVAVIAWSLLSSTSSMSQNLNHLHMVGNSLLQDLSTGGQHAYISKEIYPAFLEKAVFQNLEEELSEAKKAQTVTDYYAKGISDYSSRIKEIKNYLVSWGVDLKTLSVYAVVPLESQVYEYVNSFNPADPKAGEHNISTLSCHFFIGNAQKRMIVPGVLVAYDGTYQVFRLDEPVSAFEYKDSDYEYIHNQIQRLIELALAPSDFVNGSPLYGEEFSDIWSLCSVQILGDDPPTLIKLPDPTTPFSARKKEIWLEMFVHVAVDKGYEYLIDLLNVFFQEFTIEPSDDNQLGLPSDIKVYARQALQNNTETGGVSAVFDIKDGSGDKVIFDTHLDLTPNEDVTVNLTLRMFSK